MKRILITLLCLLMLCLSVYAEEEAYTFDDIKESMKGGNAELRKAEEIYRQSLLDVRDAKANYQPKVSLLLTGTYMPNPPVGKTSISAEELSSQLGITIPGAAAGEYVTLYKGMKSLYYNAGLTVTQPLFTWGKIPASVNLYSEIAAIRALSVKDSTEKLTVELKTRLAALCYMKELFSLLDETQSKADELVKMSQDAMESGMLLKEDVAEAKISALEVDMKKKELEKEYRDNAESIRALTGMSDLDVEKIDYSVNEEEIMRIASLDKDDVMSLITREDSAVIGMLRGQTRAYELKKKIARSSLYWKPDFALQMSLTYGGSSLPLAERNWYRTDDYGLYITLAVSTTLWDGGVKLNDVERASSEIRGTLADYDKGIDELRSTAEENLSQEELSLSKLEYYDMKIETAEGKLNLLKSRMDSGSISKKDVLSKEIELLTLKMTAIQEKITLTRASYTVAYLTGILD